MTCDLVRILSSRLVEKVTNLCILYIQERPCTRCIKRNIGHLCHDELREPAKRPKAEQSHTASDNEMSLKLDDTSKARIIQSLEQQQVDQQLLEESSININSTRSATQAASVPNPPSNVLGPAQPSRKPVIRDALCLYRF